jgi:mono/diheme cytochrome c family protein
MGEDRGGKIPSFTGKTDAESIQRGRDIFIAQCTFCHKANSTETIIGPGLKGILKKAKLPVSKKPATPENIVHQMKRPYQKMPSFPYLTDEEIQNILAYLNTL